MYYMTYHTGRKCWYGKFNSEVDSSDFRIGIIDTDDMIEETVSKSDLEKLFSNKPDIQVNGIRHSDSGRIISIYDSTNICNWFVDEEKNYAISYEQFTDRGSFIKFALYKKGLGKIAERSSGHVNGRYDFDLRNLEVRKTSGGDMIMVDVKLCEKSRSYDLNDIVITVSSRGIEFRHFPDDNELKNF